ncbi:MAG: hypothetical protein AAF311_07475 [Pseudomonadota bacterium]
MRYAARAAASLAFGLATIVTVWPGTAVAQAAPNMAAQADVPDEAALARLVWAAMVTLDNANDSGDYGVLHATGSQELRRANTPEQLAATFAPMRDNRIDLTRTLSVMPTYYLAPAFDAQGRLRLRGAFEQRPRTVRFDLLFAFEGGEWRPSALSVVDVAADAPR